MSKADRYSSFKKISGQVCRMINVGDYCGAWEYFLENNNEGFTIQELLRLKMDQYNPNKLIHFAEHISLDQTEIEQYNYYFREKARFDTYKYPSTTPLDLVKVLGDVSERMGRNPYRMEFYTSYINYIISTHKLNFWARYILPINRTKLSLRCEKIYTERYRIDSNLRAFRMNFCDLDYTCEAKCSCKFKNKMDLKMEIAMRDANIISNMYLIAYTAAKRSSVQEFVSETIPAMHDVLRLRKWYGYESFTLLDISIEMWLKAYLCLLFKSVKAIEEGELVVRISKRDVEAFFCHVDIPLEYVATIIDYFTLESGKNLQKEVVDDYRVKPLLRYRGHFYLLPYVTIASDIINVIIQGSKKENSKKLDKRGKTYENITRAKWQKVVRRVEQCSDFEKSTNTHHECDMAFVFDDCLFICELKNEAQAYSFEDWKRFEIKKDENMAQLIRITNFFKNNNKLKKALRKQKSWMPRKVISLLLYSGSCGKPQKMGDVYIANEQDVFCFFNRTPIVRMDVNPQSEECEYVRLYLPGYEYLKNQKHRLTIEDFDSYMELPMCTKQILNELKEELDHAAEMN